MATDWGDSIPCRWGRAENNTVHFRGQLVVAPQEYNLIVRIYVHGHIAKGECWLIASWSFAPELSPCDRLLQYWGIILGFTELLLVLYPQRLRPFNIDIGFAKFLPPLLSVNNNPSS